MKRNILVLLALCSFLLVACTPQSPFEQAVADIEEIDQDYNASIRQPPATLDAVNNLRAQLIGYKIHRTDVPQPIQNYVDVRVKLLEAEALHAEAWVEGRRATTEFGFGCKAYNVVKNSTVLRKKSVQIGFEATGLLEAFIETYPSEAETLNLVQKDALTLKGIYLQIQEKAEEDNQVIESFCGENA